MLSAINTAEGMGCGLNTFSKKNVQKSITKFDLKTN
jgi:hypothetical protein